MNVRSSFLGLLLVGALSSAAAPALAKPDDPASAEVSPADREKSRAAFRRGVTQLRSQDWAGARASFEEAWSLVQHPSILLNLGIARLRTDDPVLAEQDLVHFLTEDTGASAEELASAREALSEARAKIGTLKVATTPSTAHVTVDGKPVTCTEIRLKAGKHTIVAEAPGYTLDQHDVDVPAKGEVDHKVVLVAAGETKGAGSGPEKSRTRRIVGFSLAGVAGVGLITSGALALEAASLSSDYENPRSKSFQSPAVKSEGVGYRTGADVVFLVAALAGTGAILLLFTDVASNRIHRRPEPALLHW